MSETVALFHLLVPIYGFLIFCCCCCCCCYFHFVSLFLLSARWSKMRERKKTNAFFFFLFINTHLYRRLTFHCVLPDVRKRKDVKKKKLPEMEVIHSLRGGCKLVFETVIRVCRRVGGGIIRLVWNGASSRPDGERLRNESSFDAQLGNCCWGNSNQGGRDWLQNGSMPIQYRLLIKKLPIRVVIVS